MRVIVITNFAPKNINELITIKDNDYIIAVDGALEQINLRKIKVDLVIGDFDSLKRKKLLKKYQIITLNKEKDITDTFSAIKYAYTLSDEVILLGGIQGNRIEHFVANLTLFNIFNNLIIIDNNSKISLLKEGNHIVFKNKYVSFFAKEDAIISLKGFKYNLNKYNLKQYDPLAISNEVLKSYGEVKIISGSVYLIETK